MNESHFFRVVYLLPECLCSIRQIATFDKYSGLHITTYVVRDPDGRKLAERETEAEARESARSYAERRAA